MMRIGRLLKHIFVTPGALHRAFPRSTLERIKEAIAATETRHSGEIRFAMEAALPWSYLRRNAPARQRALMVFSKLRVWDTERDEDPALFFGHESEVHAVVFSPEGRWPSNLW